MKKITALIISITLLTFLPLIYPASVTSANFVTSVNAYIDIDPYSVLEMDNSETEVGLYREIRVKLTDRLGNPLAGRVVELYSDTEGLQFEHITGTTDPDGYYRTKVRSFSPGVYTIRAKDISFDMDIAIQDAASLYVFPVPVPVLDHEPYYTPGTSNVLSWDRLTGMSDAYEYMVEVSLNPEFTNIVKTTAWLTTARVDIAGLSGGKMYFYRIKARNTDGGVSAYSGTVFSVQDASEPVIKHVEEPQIIKEEGRVSIRFKFIVSDDLSLKKVDLYCQTSTGREKCGTLQSTGASYTAMILMEELEKDRLFRFKEKYNFCVEAMDEAGNRGTDCSFEIKLEEGSEIPIPVFANVINSLLNGINGGIERIADTISFILDGLKDLYLVMLSILLMAFSILISLSIMLYHGL